MSPVELHVGDKQAANVPLNLVDENGIRRGFEKGQMFVITAVDEHGPFLSPVDQETLVFGFTFTAFLTLFAST